MRLVRGASLAEAQNYDVVIIGSGPGGYVAAIRAGQLGLKTALIEKDDKFGGTCLHVGCIPTKALLFDAEVYDYFRNAQEYGIDCPGFSVDWPAIQARKTRIVQKLAKGVDFLLKKNKVDTIHGYARLAGPQRVTVTDTKNQVSEIRAAKTILATGSEARMLPGLEPDGMTILTNKEVLNLKKIPKSIAIIGAGAVGVEFASIFHRFGAKVRVLEMLKHAVPMEDEEISAELEKAFRQQAIELLTEAKVQKVSKTGTGVTIEYTDARGSVLQLESESLLVAVGRAPNTRGIGLEKTRVRLDHGFVKVDEYQQTDEPGVYAIGDIVAASPQLAHVAQMQGIVAATHAAGQTAEAINLRQIPSCTYCEPEVASVGLTEKQAREAGHKTRVGKFPFAANSKAAILGARQGFVKIVSSEPYGEILGVHMIGPRVTELIAEAVVTMRLEGTIEDLAHTIHAHPTLAEAVLEAAHAASGKAIHL